MELLLYDELVPQMKSLKTLRRPAHKNIY